MTTPTALAARLLAAHPMVGDYFTADAGWVNYACLCGVVFTDAEEHTDHLAAALASAGLLTTEPPAESVLL